MRNRIPMILIFIALILSIADVGYEYIQKSSQTCTTGGLMRYDSMRKKMQYCNESAWIDIQ